MTYQRYNFVTATTVKFFRSSYEMLFSWLYRLFCIEQKIFERFTLWLQHSSNSTIWPMFVFIKNCCEKNTKPLCNERCLPPDAMYQPTPGLSIFRNWILGLLFLNRSHHTVDRLNAARSKNVFTSGLSCSNLGHQKKWSTLHHIENNYNYF